MKLGDRMKQYEAKQEVHLNENEPFVVRIDGHGFSKSTKGLSLPFDERFSLAMIKMTADVKETWKADIAYTQSDESTFVFFPKLGKNDNNKITQLAFNGRLTKIASLISGYASARFNYYLSRLFNQETVDENENINVRFEGQDYAVISNSSIQKLEQYHDKCLTRMLSGSAHFDARVFNVPSDIEALNCIYWRASYDCIRNSVSKACAMCYSHKETHAKNTKEKIAMMLERGFDWKSIHPGMRYGVYIKSEKYEKEVEYINKKDNTTQSTKVMRQRDIYFTLQLNLVSQEGKEKLIELMKSKYLDEKILDELSYTNFVTNQSFEHIDN